MKRKLENGKCSKSVLSSHSEVTTGNAHARTKAFTKFTQKHQLTLLYINLLAVNFHLRKPGYYHLKSPVARIQGSINFQPHTLLVTLPMII